MLKRSMLSLCIASSLLLVAGCDSGSSNPFTPTDEDTTETSDTDGSGGDTGTTDESSGDGESTDGASTDDSGDDGSEEAPGGEAGSDGDDESDGDGDGDTSDGDDGNAPVPPAPTTSIESEASYRLTFEATWSASTHPLNFPSDPHFSGVTGATHNGAVNFWQPGQLATQGFQNVAETGNRTVFVEEIRASVNAGTSRQLIEGGGITVSPNSVSVNFQASQQHPLVTIASMVAPSPDWIVGVHDLDLRGADGNFVDSLIVDAIIYDAGTDSGLIYATGNAVTNPQAPITRLTSNSTDTNIVQGLPSAGRFIFQKQ